MSVLWQRRTHGVQRRQAQLDRTLARIFLAVVLVVTVLAAAYLSLAASNVRLSRHVWAMEQALGEAERTNQALAVGIARWSSIPVLQERSVALGYAPAQNVEYLRVEP